jgi:hypothetical protein
MIFRSLGGLDDCDRSGLLQNRIEQALDLARRYGQIDGAHHKTWVIDQMCRELLRNDYEDFVKESKDGEYGPDTYEWDEGIAP